MSGKSLHPDDSSVTVWDIYQIAPPPARCACGGARRLTVRNCQTVSSRQQWEQGTPATVNTASWRLPLPLHLVMWQNYTYCNNEKLISTLEQCLILKLDCISYTTKQNLQDCFTFCTKTIVMQWTKSLSFHLNLDKWTFLTVISGSAMGTISTVKMNFQCEVFEMPDCIRWCQDQIND